jgi:ABC-type multidrug transport system fused ATPase/permease subunit
MKKSNLFEMWKLTDRKYLFLLNLMCSFVLTSIYLYLSNMARLLIDGKNVNGDLKTVVLMGIMLAAGVGICFLLAYSSGAFSIRNSEKFRNMVVDKLNTCQYGYFDQHNSGEIDNKIATDINSISDYMAGGLVEFVSGIVSFILSTIYLLTINWKMTLVACICVPISVLISKLVSGQTYQTMKDFNQEMDNNISFVKETVMNTKAIKAFNLQKHRKTVFGQKMDVAVQYFVKYEKIVALTSPVKYLIKSSPTLICIIFAFYCAYKGTITNGTFVAFVLLSKNITNPASELIRHITDLMQAKVSVSRVLSILQFEDEKSGTESASPSTDVFKIEHVSFAYKEEKEVLKDVSLTIQAGQVVAFAGSSGSGKSTLFKLLLGYYLPTSGTIELYGKDLGSWDKDLARKQISYISQNVFLFNGTVEENISAGDQNVTFQEVVDAAKKAYAHDFIIKLPNGYKTVLNEMGSNFSGGQRQRLSIARAFLKNAPIFVFDEITSALDPESEALIRKAIDEFSQTKTVIMIAHRLSTIEHADVIYVFKDGQIVEQGNHHQLIKQKGMYTQLYQNQLTKEEKGDLL